MKRNFSKIIFTTLASIFLCTTSISDMQAAKPSHNQLTIELSEVDYDELPPDIISFFVALRGLILCFNIYPWPGIKISDKIQKLYNAVKSNPHLKQCTKFIINGVETEDDVIIKSASTIVCHVHTELTDAEIEDKIIEARYNELMNHFEQYLLGYSPLSPCYKDWGQMQ